MNKRLEAKQTSTPNRWELVDSDGTKCGWIRFRGDQFYGQVCVNGSWHEINRKLHARLNWPINISGSSLEEAVNKANSYRDNPSQTASSFLEVYFSRF